MRLLGVLVHVGWCAYWVSSAPAPLQCHRNHTQHMAGGANPCVEPAGCRRLIAWLVGPPGGGPWGLLHAALRMLCHGEAHAAMKAMAHVDAASGPATAFVKVCYGMHV